MTSIIFSL